jgi:hypothetical protein
VFDWLLVIAFIIAFLAIDKVNGHQQEFSLSNQSIMYTFAVKETVPTWLLSVCAVVIPITIVLVWTLVIPPLGTYQRRRWRKGEMTIKEKLWDANLSLLGIGLAIASTITVTNTFKNLVGRTRPGASPASLPTNGQIFLIVVNPCLAQLIQLFSHCQMPLSVPKRLSSRMVFGLFPVAILLVCFSHSVPLILQSRSPVLDFWHCLSLGD